MTRLEQYSNQVEFAPDPCSLWALAMLREAEQLVLSHHHVEELEEWCPECRWLAKLREEV